MKKELRSRQCDGKKLKVLSMMHEVRKAGLREEGEGGEKGDKVTTERQGSKAKKGKTRTEHRKEDGRAKWSSGGS